MARSKRYLIDRLTPEQQARLPEIAAEWIGYGLSTLPADRPAAEAALARAYERASVPWHGRVIWCDSPLSLVLTDTILRELPSVWDSVWASVRDSVWASVRDSVGASVWDSVGASVRASVWDSVGDSVWASVRDSVGASVRDSVWASVGDSVWDSVGDSVWDSVGDSVWDSVWDSVGASVNSYWETAWLAFYAVFREFGVSACERLDGLSGLHQSAGWWIARQHAALIAERPTTLQRDEHGQLHAEDGPAIAWPDGWGIYAWHGVRVPEQVIRRPETLTAAQIRDEPNVEVRRVMLERFGAERYVREIGATVVHRDDFGTLYRAELADDEPLVLVKVVNSTPEPDGSFRDYWLRVPPTVQTAREAVAWTFDTPADEYSPALQT